jgi:CheY-like chemotaxis protein
MKTILLADDNPAIREFLREVLLVSGYEVREVDDGVAVLEALQQTLPDVLVMDIQMPRMDGYAVVRHVRQQLQFAQLPVIALTANAMRGDRERVLAAGFDAYCTKPVDLLTLTREIERLIGGR